MSFSPSLDVAVPVHRSERLAFLSVHPSPIALLFSTSNTKVIEDIPNALSYTASSAKQILLQLQTALNKQAVGNISLMRAIVAIATKLDAVMLHCDTLMEKPLIKLIIAEPSLLSQAIFSTDAAIIEQLAQFVLIDAFGGFESVLAHPSFAASHTLLLDNHIDNHSLMNQRLAQVKDHALDYLTVLKLAPTFADSYHYLNALMRLKEHGHDLTAILDQIKTANTQTITRLFMICSTELYATEAEALLAKYPNCSLSLNLQCLVERLPVSTNLAVDTYTYEPMVALNEQFALMECHLKGHYSNPNWKFLLTGTADLGSHPLLFSPLLLLRSSTKNYSTNELASMIVDQYSAQQILTLLDRLAEENESDLEFISDTLYQLSLACKMPAVFEWIKKHFNALLLMNSIQSKMIILRCISAVLSNSDNISRETRLDYILAITDKLLKTKDSAIRDHCSKIICALIDILYLDAKASWTRYKDLADCVGIGMRAAKELASRYTEYTQQQQEDVGFELDLVEREVVDYAVSNDAYPILSVIPTLFYNPVGISVNDSTEYVSFASKVLECEIQSMPRPVLLGTGGTNTRQRKPEEHARQHAYTFATLCTWSDEAAISEKEAKTRFDVFMKTPINIMQLPWFLRPTLPVIISKFITSLIIATAESQWIIEALDKVASSNPSLTAYAVYILNAVASANTTILESNASHRDRIYSWVSGSTNEEALIAGMHALGTDFARKFIDQGGVYKSMYAGYCVGAATETQDEALLKLMDERAYFGHCYAQWVHNRNVPLLHESSSDPLIIQSNCLLTGKAPSTPINEPIDTKYAIALCTSYNTGSTIYNRDHLDGKAPAQFRMNALMALAGELGWNPVLLSYKNTHGLDEGTKEILISISKGADSKSALIASMMLLSCRQETVAKGDSDTIVGRFNADGLFAHLLQHHPAIAIDALSRCTLVPRLDWTPYLTHNPDSAMCFCMKHVRRDTPNGVYYMPSLCTFISEHVDALRADMIMACGIEPLMFIDDFWSVALNALASLETDHIIDLVGKHAPKHWIDALPLDINTIDAFLWVNTASPNKFTPFIEFVKKVKTEPPVQSICSLPNTHTELYEYLLFKHLPVLSLKECLKTCISVIDRHSTDHPGDESLNRIAVLIRKLIVKASDRVLREAGEFELAWVVAKERETDLVTKLLKRIPALGKN